MNRLDRLNSYLYAHWDKLAHFAGGTVLAGIGAIWCLPFAMALPVALGFAKELWDLKHPPHQASIWDFMVTVAGGVPIWVAYMMGVHHGI